MNNTTDKYSSLKELQESCQYGIDYNIEFSEVPSPISVIAIHGNGIEGGTSEIAKALAHKGHYSYYCFNGIRNNSLDCTENLELHITSGKFLDTKCLEIVGNSIGTISVHGADEEISCCYVGGVILHMQIL